MTDETFLTTKLYKKGGLYVKAAATNPAAGADYMVVELATGKVAFYANAAAVPSGITDAKYKTTHMAFRRISAAGRVARLGRGRGETCHANYAATTLPAYLHEFADDYYMAVYETTIGHYIALGKTYGGNYGQNAYSGKAHHADHQTDWQWHPLESISTAVAADLATTLQTRFRAATSLGYVFAIPTSPEWEFAARGETKGSIFSVVALDWNSQNTRDHIKPIGFNIQASEEYYGGAQGVGHPQYVSSVSVRLKVANPYGLYDVIGNVDEWCDGWFDEEQTKRSFRGGSMHMSGEGMGVGYCIGLGETATSGADSLPMFHEMGFRVACTIP